MLLDVRHAARCTVLLAVATVLATSCDRPRPGAGTSGRGETAATPSTRPCPFADRAESLGVRFTYRNGSEADQCTILEPLGGGVGWFDYDRDGGLDLIATGGGGFAPGNKITGRQSALFRNLGGQAFVEVTANSGVASATLYTNGLTVGDYDNDGFQDFVVTGYGAPQLWHNMGDGTFVEAAAQAGIDNSLWGSSAGWADLNADGDLDLYLAHYVDWSFENHPYCASGRPGLREICAPRVYAPLPDCVYYNRGEGTFEDASAQAGLRLDGKGLGVVLFDAEPDGDVDIYVANDTTDNFLYLNDGRGKFEEVGIARGVAYDDRGIPNGSMGVDVCDFNRDGRPDLWVANYEHESFALYRNEGGGNFLHVSQRLGITDLGGLFVGFGTSCDDFDGDGDQDFIVANGHVIKYPEGSSRQQLPLLLEFDGRRFQRAQFAPGSYFSTLHEGRGLAVADYDADGDLDIAISHLNQPLALLENQFHEQNRWLDVRLIGTRGNRDAVGARVKLQQGERVEERQVTGGSSYQSHHARDVHFVLLDKSPPDGSRTLTIHWPSGGIQSLDASSLTGLVSVIEPLDAADKSARIFSSGVPQ